ncbi:histone deacetylase [Yasminevirus sp. GU-2018]|uniref:histone deacetylase n=1 Tax=Yasminevirus sp. GU-2018 TaxID=2420051 RepID=A0A5K0U7B2_9VIRU|nr:histone deacetylase [Yasminevirus sp. GU-2018]
MSNTETTPSSGVNINAGVSSNTNAPVNSQKQLDVGSTLIKNLLTKIKQKKYINPIAYVDDPLCDGHKLTTKDHQESPDRTKIIRTAIQKYGIDKMLIRSGSITIRLSDLHEAHDKDYIELLTHCGRINKPIEVPKPSTEVSMTDIGSFHAVLGAASSVMGGVDTVCGDFRAESKDYRYVSKRIRKVFCNVRPPGHHAHHDHGAGFCFVNNVAVGVKFAMNKYPSFIKKVLIFDWDLHHGDGTEDIFKDNPNIMYVSFHRGGNRDGTDTDDENAFYPFTGTTHINKHGNVINFPIGKNESVESYMKKFREEFLPRAYAFKPDLVMLSAGFDSHKDDLYHALPLDYSHFREMTIELMKLADKCSSGRLVSCLEGGYTLNVLYKCVAVHVLTMIDGYD